jgi:hypothetical protein
MYGIDTWYVHTYPHDPTHPWSWEVVWRQDGWGRRCVCRGVAKTRGACVAEIEALLIGLESPVATRIWCAANTY